MDGRPLIVYSYWEYGRKKCTGTVKELSEKLGKTENYIRVLNYRPTRNRWLNEEGHIMPIYEIHNIDGNVEFTGTAEECMKHMRWSYETFYLLLNEQKNGKRNGKKGALLIRLKERKFIKTEF